MTSLAREQIAADIAELTPYVDFDASKIPFDSSTQHRGITGDFRPRPVQIYTNYYDWVDPLVTINIGADYFMRDYDQRRVMLAHHLCKAQQYYRSAARLYMSNECPIFTVGYNRKRVTRYTDVYNPFAYPAVHGIVGLVALGNAFIKRGRWLALAGSVLPLTMASVSIYNTRRLCFERDAMMLVMMPDRTVARREFGRLLEDGVIPPCTWVSNSERVAELRKY